MSVFTTHTLRAILLSACASFALIAACSAADETGKSPEPTPVTVSVNDRSMANEITVDGYQEFAVTPDVMASNQSKGSSAANDVRQADSHVHGAANLALALDGETISVELESPLYTLVGFEHAPETAAQIKVFETAEAALSQPGTLLQFNPEAGCTANPIKGVTLMPDDAPKNHDEHGHDHDAEDDSDYAHKDALLTYSFTCLNPVQLRWLDTRLFDVFDNLAKIDLVYLGPSQQISMGLTPSSDRIQLVD